MQQIRNKRVIPRQLHLLHVKEVSRTIPYLYLCLSIYQHSRAPQSILTVKKVQRILAVLISALLIEL